MGEIKAAFAKRTLRSVENIHYRFSKTIATPTVKNFLNSSLPWIREKNDW